MHLLLLGTVLAGGVTHSVDDEVSLRLELATQTRVDLVSAEGALQSEVRVSRVRPMLFLETESGQARGFFHAQVWHDEIELLDLFFDARLHPSGWVARTGVLKLPYTVYRQRPWFSLPLTEWSHTARAFGSERQIGTQVSGPAGGLHWTFGVFSGQNERAAHAIRLPALYGEPAQTRLSLTRSAGSAPRLHPELFFQLAAFGEGLEPREGRERTGSQPLALGGALSFAADAQPKHRQDMAARAAVEVMAQGHGLGLHAVGYTSIVPLTQGLAPGLHGGLVEMSLRVGPRFELALRAAGVWTSPALLRDAVTWRGAEGALDPRTPWSAELELGVGWNLFLPDARRIVMIEAQPRRDVLSDGTTRDRTLLRAQLQWLF
ncbi:MAG: hypothetical protein EA397_00855 [Deltaproteobacteria bacterium]|nr:MAG: hypothetical protein EA397_00855 [Deltaproteobacteria bacterium]